MQIKCVTLENFRAKKHLALKIGRHLTLLIGENGTGKTTILDAIAIGLGAVLTHLPNVSGLSFKKTGDIYQLENKQAAYTRITLETTDGMRWDRTQRRDKSKKTASQISNHLGVRALEKYLDQQIIDPLNANQECTLPLFVYYGVGRALLDLPLSRKGFPKQHTRFEALTNTLEANSRFKSAFVWFYNKEDEELRRQKECRSFDITLPELNAVRTAFAALFPDLKNPHIALNPLRFLVQKDGELLNIGQLSDGYKTLLGLVIDLSARMAIANPHLPDPLATQAVVMIDEIDLHLHPAWQRRVLGDLLKTFKNTQFIITTHSPYIVESINNYLKRNQVAHLVPEEDEIKNLIPLSATEISAYLLNPETEQSLLNTELGLLDDQFIHQFNEITQLYDKMRDLEWAARGD